jgi:cytochrome b561
MKSDTPNQLGHTTVSLHWIVAIAVIGLLAVGVYMTQTSTLSLYPWHKSFGFSIFFVALLRIIWLMITGWPVPVSQYRRIERILARTVQWLLLLGTILMPISGFLMSSLGGHGVDVFGFEVVARNPDPSNPGKVLPYNAMWASFFSEVHELLGYTLIAAVVLHLSGALKHHLIDKDGTLRRMLGASVDVQRS